MDEFKFVPQIGMVTNDSFLHGIGENEHICQEGRIEFVAQDYFILRIVDIKEPILVYKDRYWCIEENDFK